MFRYQCGDKYVIYCSCFVWKACCCQRRSFDTKSYYVLTTHIYAINYLVKIKAEKGCGTVFKDILHNVTSSVTLFTSYRWFSARLQYLQCISNGDTTVLHKTINISEDGSLGGVPLNFGRNWQGSHAAVDFQNDSTRIYEKSTFHFINNVYGPLARYGKLRVAHALGMPGTFPRYRLQRKPLVSDPGMHHGTCFTHVPWYMSGSLTRCSGENVPGIPGASQPAIFRIWQEAHIP